MVIECWPAIEANVTIFTTVVIAFVTARFWSVYIYDIFTIWSGYRNALAAVAFGDRLNAESARGLHLYAARSPDRSLRSPAPLKHAPLRLHIRHTDGALHSRSPFRFRFRTRHRDTENFPRPDHLPGSWTGLAVGVDAEISVKSKSNLIEVIFRLDPTCQGLL